MARYSKKVASDTIFGAIMSTQDKARELLAKDRQQDQHLHDTMTARAAETDNTVTDDLDEKARELLVGDRQHDKFN